MPREAFVPHTNCVAVFFVSHRWESLTDPDVSGRQSLFLRLFLAARLLPDDLDRVGVWYDYSVLPQEPRSAIEQQAFDAILQRLPDIQSVSHTLLSGDADSLRDYASRAWCLLEHTGGTPVTPDYAFGGISYRSALGHAVANNEADAVEQAIAYVTMRYASLEELPWQCPVCGVRELVSRALQSTHDCARTGAADPAIKKAWIRLDSVCAVVRNAGLEETFPTPLQSLIRQRRTSWLDMVIDFNWAHHCMQCGAVDSRMVRRASMNEVEVLCMQFAQSHDKSIQFLREIFTDDRPDNSSLENAATTLAVKCTWPRDVAVVMRLMWDHGNRILGNLARNDLVNNNGATSAHCAAQWQDLTILKHLVSRNALLLDARDKSNWTLLHSALFGWSDDGTEVVHWLLSVRPGLVYERSDTGEPPVAIAARYANATTVDLLLSHAPGLIDCKIVGGDSLLHLAAWNSNVKNSDAIAHVLLSKSPSLADQRNHSGETVLRAAAAAANVPLVRRMLALNPSLIAERDLLGDTILCTAVHPNVGGGVGQRVLEIAQLLLDASPALAGALDYEGCTADECVGVSDCAAEIQALIRRHRE